jgi:ABC-type dipeptide/oligopeptide/nickel transport system permease component
MFRYLIRRVLWAAVLFVVVTLVTYVIFFLVPNDLAAKVAGQGSSQEQRARRFTASGSTALFTSSTASSCGS